MPFFGGEIDHGVNVAIAKLRQALGLHAAMGISVRNPKRLVGHPETEYLAYLVGHCEFPSARDSPLRCVVELSLIESTSLEKAGLSGSSS
jgi:hypothetical protein